MKCEFIYGIHAVASVLEHNPSRLLTIMIAKDSKNKRLDEITALANEQGIAVEYTHQKTLAELASEESHQSIIAKARPIKSLNENELYDLLDNLTKPALLLILDGVQDPHNLGACLRTADAAAVDAVIIPKDKSVSLTPTVQKVASGAAETMPFVEVTNLARTLDQLKQRNIWIYGFTDKANESVYTADLKGSLALVLGAEGKGMRDLTEKHCDALYALPMQGHVASLNVSVAAGVCLYEAVRQRHAGF